MSKRYTITAALPYANGPIHIGHLAGVYIPSDIFARYLRRKKQEVLYVCGSDEHGVPVTIRAKKEGISVQDVVDRYHHLIKNTFEELNISFDHYDRTTSPQHHEVASDFFTHLYKKGIFLEEVSEQFYDEEAKEFLADRYITGECPNCGNPNAYGDQCEKCGSTLSPDELINPKSTLSGNIPIKKETKNWYLPLDKYETFLREWVLEEHKEDWKTNVLGQVKSWLDDGLKPRAMTRDLDWGIPVPLKEAEGKVLYVWFDAPIGYISFTQNWAKKSNKDWKPYWQDKDTELVHFIGKDNIVFHCVIFPVMLKAHGDYILPKNVPANEFLNLENDKISTSRNWAVWAHEYVKDFPGKQDVLRYALTANLPENKDNNFTWKDFQTKNNSELVGILGNFFNRVMVLTHKYFDGVVPPSQHNYPELENLSSFPKKIGTYLEKYEFRNALKEYMNLARLGNQFLQSQEPWKKIKETPKEVESILNGALQVAAMLAQCAEPFLPNAAEKMLGMLNMQELDWNNLLAQNTLLNDGHTLEKASLLFDKIEDKEIELQLEKLNESKRKNQMTNLNAEPQKEEITFDDFQKMDIRIGTILEAYKVKKADRLYELKVDTGVDVRTIVSGIAESFTLEEIIGKKALVLINLAPRKIKGIESQGMLLFTDQPDGKLSFLAPEGETENGAQVG